MSLLNLVLQDDTGSAAGGAAAAGMGMGLMLFWLALVVVLVASWWKMFEKAGQPGWAAIVPIYNLYILLKVAGRPGWWLVLAFIPFVNLILVIVPFDVARRFGKGVGFGVGLLFLGIVFYPILAFGDAQYQG